MDRGTRLAFIGVLAVVVAVAVVVWATSGTVRSDGTPVGSDPVVGVIVAVDSAGLGDVRSFDLRMTDGTVRTFGLAALENAVEFPPGHLVEHQASAEPVRVWWRSISGVDQAIRLEDAPVS